MKWLFTFLVIIAWVALLGVFILDSQTSLKLSVLSAIPSCFALFLIGPAFGLKGNKDFDKDKPKELLFGFDFFNHCERIGGILKGILAGYIACLHHHHWASRRGDPRKRDLTLKIIAPQVTPFGDRFHLGGIINDAYPTNGICRAVIALRCLGKFIKLTKIREFRTVHFLKYVFLDTDLGIGIGEKCNIDTFATPNLQLVQSVGIIAGLESNFTAA